MDSLARGLIDSYRAEQAAEAQRSKRVLEEWRALRQTEPVRLRDGRLVPPIGGGSLQTFQETLVANSIAGTLFNTYTTAKTVIPPICLFQFPPNYLYIGKVFRVRVTGGISNIVTTPGTITFQVMMGSIVAWTSGAIQLNATAHTTLPFTLDVLLTCRAIGITTSANYIGQGVLSGIMFTVTAGQVDGVNTETVLQVPRTAPAVGTGFDSTIANTLDFWVGFSISNAGNGVQVQQYVVEALN